MKKTITEEQSKGTKSKPLKNLEIQTDKLPKNHNLKIYEDGKNLESPKGRTLVKNIGVPASLSPDNLSRNKKKGE